MSRQLNPIQFIERTNRDPNAQAEHPAGQSSFRDFVAKRQGKTPDASSADAKPSFEADIPEL